MRRQAVISKLLAEHNQQAVKSYGQAFAPANIALIKYWGKRDEALKLPVTSSLSLSLGSRGATTTVRLADQDSLSINGVPLDSTHAVTQRLITFLDLFRFDKNYHYHVESHSNIPLAAGLASSASGFAALVKALADLFAWPLSLNQLSIIARLGSGSASRSLWHGFVLWQRGERKDGMDSSARLLAPLWSNLRVGLLLIDSGEKKISSTQAMRQTIDSRFYKVWPQQVSQDLLKMRQAIDEENFQLLGQTAENNALAMHASMMTAQPAVIYSKPQTLVAMEKVWQLRQHGLSVFFTQDAGPNLKLLFQHSDSDKLKLSFPEIDIIIPDQKG